MIDPPTGRAGAAYLVRPDGPDGPAEGTGSGVLVLGSWWGLTPALKAFAEHLSDHGFVALVPDLLGGRRPETSAEAELELASVDPNAAAALVLSSVVALRSQTSDPSGPIAVVGFSMGASWALWLAGRQPESVDKVVAYYGTQHIDFTAMRAPVLGHFADRDELVHPDDLVALETELFEAGHTPEIWHYPETAHFFAESGQDGFDEAAADLAWLRTLEFLQRASER